MNETAVQLIDTERQLVFFKEASFGYLSKTQETFEGDKDLTRTFVKYMNYFSISNIGDRDLSFTINGIDIPVPSKLGYEGFFEEFIKVEIKATSRYTAIVKSDGDKYITVTDTFTNPVFGRTETGQDYIYSNSGFPRSEWSSVGGHAHVVNANGISDSHAVIDTNSVNASVKSDITIGVGGMESPGYILKKVKNSKNRILIRGNALTSMIVLVHEDEVGWKTIKSFPFVMEIGETYNMEFSMIGRKLTFEADGVEIGSYTLTAEEYRPIKNGTEFGMMVKDVDSKHDNLVIKPFGGDV